MNADRYNPAALNNKGNTVFVKQDYEKAAEFYKEALRNDSSCTEALYNLGIVLKSLDTMRQQTFFFFLHFILFIHFGKNKPFFPHALLYIYMYCKLYVNLCLICSCRFDL